MRNPQEFIAGHFPGAINHPLESIHLVKFQKNIPIYLFCHSGARSKLAAIQLNKAGYRAYNVSGGIIDWTGPLERGS